MSKSIPNLTVACFGEILWDCVPRGLFLGGAPLNVAYHLARHELHVLPIGAVGQDFLGEEARRRMAEWDLDLRFVTSHPRRPTGTVQGALDAEGTPTYRIARSVAWDWIELPNAFDQVEPAPAAILFGTLALREAPNRRTLTQLLNAWPDTLRIVDLNLRPPFDRPEVITFVLERAQMLKVSHSELSRLTDVQTAGPSALQRAARQLSAQHGIASVCVTVGDQGAGLLWQDEWFWEKARPVKVRDTIGAGDAFLAGLLASLLARSTPPKLALANACRLAEFVAASDGPTPAYECDPNRELRMV